jgi:hypothetical protein
VATLLVGAESPQGVGAVVGSIILSTLPTSATIAILRYRLYEIDLLINRTLVYGAVSLVLVASYVAVVVFMQPLLRPLTSGSELSVAASTLVTVGLFQPARRRAQDIVDRRFYRARYDATLAVDGLSARLRDEVEIDAVRAHLLDAVDQTLRPAHAQLWLRESGRAP